MVPENLVRLLHMNTNEDKVILAREKIIAYHFRVSMLTLKHLLQLRGLFFLVQLDGLVGISLDSH